MTQTQKNYLIYGGGALVLIVAAYYAFKPKDGGSDTDPTGNGNTVPDTGKFDPFVTATTLWKAMYQSGTNENMIFAALKNVSQAQFAQVIQKFGQLKYNPTLGNQVNLNPFSDLDRYDLQFWLENELSESSYETLRLKYPNYL
ncbi:hypothetical protein MH928_17255 [Flavobacterium sp. WW92]|uniref:hypothetical protein n=1 Tax=unclassified Flavobacterium TaxID=196869 RepID=UPI0022252681|nr:MULTISPECIES: hypothetical protein [unclassified Flavobacterium]WDO13056.1 hypothetical protein MH928_17255 [Flavobacterium sp. WW92]